MTKNNIKRDKGGRFAQGKKGGPGRPRKVVGTGKPLEDFIQAYNVIGGAEGLAKWANQNNSNRSLFYSLLMRMIPREMAEKLLLYQQAKKEMPSIQYVSAECMARVRQLEEYIILHSLEVPAEEKREGLATKEGENGDKGS